MRKSLSTLLLIAAAAIAISSCNKVDPQVHEPEDVNVAESTVFHITASAVETKSVFGEKSDNSYPTLWTTNKSVAFSRDEAAFVEGVPTLVNEGASATFDVKFEGEITEGTIYAFSPLGVFDKDNASNNVPGFTSISAEHKDVYLNIPSEQTPLANSVDESAQALVGTTEYSNGNVDLSINFSHVVAYGKMAITNFAGGDIASVEITFPVNVVGSSCWYYYAGDNVGTISNQKDNTITLDPTNVVDNVFWFALAPTTGATGSMKIVVKDENEDTYTKTIDLTKKALPFVKGQVSSFTANFSGIEADEVSEYDYSGTYAIMAKKSGSYWYVTTDLGTANTKRYQAVDSGLSDLPSSVEKTDDYVWTVAKSTGGYYISTQDGLQMTWTSDNSANLAEEGKLLNIDSSTTTEGAFNISIVDTPSRILALNSSNPYFAFYTGSGVKDLYLVPATVVEPTYYIITVDATTNGTVTPSKTQAVEGETITLTVTPNEGYELATLTYNNIDIKDTKSFTMPASDVTVSATFEKRVGAQNTILDFSTKEYGTSSYQSSWDYGDWTIVNGANNNKGWEYVKMGGKKATLETYNPCYIYNNEAISHSVAKIQVDLPSGSLPKSGMSVNSWGVYVYSDKDMKNQIDYVEGGTITSAAGSFEFVPSTGTVWSKGYYYKVSWNLANTTTTNGIIWVSKISLFEN